MQIINTKIQLKNIELDTSILVIPISSSDEYHARITQLLILYIYNMETKTEYLIIINHSDYNSHISLNDLDLTAYTIYTMDKKSLLTYFDFPNVIDVNLLSYQLKNKIIKTHDLLTPAHHFYNRNYHNYKNVNMLIPIYKHYDMAVKLKNRMLRIIKNTEVNEFYNNLILTNFARIESSGLYIDKQLLKKKFGLVAANHVDKNNLIYTEYNINTITGRPSNRCGGINYAALSKKDCTRKIFKSRFDKSGILLEYDYNSYHLYLIADLVGYTFPKDITAHEYMARHYFNTKDPTLEQIEEGKEISFQLLYGMINKKYAKIEFFKMTQDLINGLWEEHNIQGYVELPLSYKRIKDVESKNKLFNYYIQGYETERNAVMLYDLLKLLKPYKSKVVLYTYDSFLIDMSFDDGKHLIKKIKKTISNDKFPIRIKYGINYGEMKILK